MLRARALAVVFLLAGCSEAVRPATITPDAPTAASTALLGAPPPRPAAPETIAPLLFRWTLNVMYDDDSKRVKDLSAGREMVTMSEGGWSCIVSPITHQEGVGGSTMELRQLQCWAGEAEASTPLFCSSATPVEGAMLILTQKNRDTQQRVQLLCSRR